MKNNSNKKLKVSAYVRVSTRSEGQRNSFDEQMTYWTDTLSNNPDYEFVKVYSDYGYSGKINNRPAYKRMIEDALAGKIDLIFCKSVSRFGRNIVTLLDDIHKLREKGVFVNFELENISTENNSNDLYLSIYSALAENELVGMSNAIKFGFQEKFKSGSCFCKPIFGYDVKKNGDDYDFSIIPEQAETVKLIFELYNAEKTFTEISAYLNENNIANKYGKAEWMPTTIPYILSNEKYAGIVYSQKYFSENFKLKKNDADNPSKIMYSIENHHEAIVSLECFNKTKCRLDSRQKKPRKYNPKAKEKDFIAEHLYCGKCNNSYRKVNRKDYHGEEVVTYRCAKNRYKGECCHNNTIYPDTFKLLFVKAYNEFAKIKNIGTEKCQLLNAQIAVQEGLIADLIKINSLGNISYNLFLTQLEVLNKEMSKLKLDLDYEVGHIIDNQRIASRTNIFKEYQTESVLDKVVVDGTILAFHFKNGVIIEKEFTNPTPGRQSKID